MEKQTGELLSRLAVTIVNMRSEVGTLSGGQRQQVAIARSLLGDPKVVILDEPTAALGVRQTALVLDLIKRLREEGHAVVVISHNLADVFEVADRIFVLRLGRAAGDFAHARDERRGGRGGHHGRHRRPGGAAMSAQGGGGAAAATADAELESPRDRPAAPLHPGRPGRAARGHRPGGDLADLLPPRAGFSQLGEPDEPGAAGHGRRAGGRGRCAGAAAGRDRSVGRRRERPVRGDHGGARGAGGLVALPGDRRRRARRDRDRSLPRLDLHPLRDTFVRGHAGGAARVARRPARGAWRDRHGQPHRSEDHRAHQHLLQRHGGLDLRAAWRSAPSRRSACSAGSGASGRACPRRRSGRSFCGSCWWPWWCWRLSGC